ncbi:RagB/SusD family nutrient uptake outer membrane protein [Siphonobacter sp. BAB-5385]|uniref:RagB/SusD family nutrient uptake outer membrane protein n=1 Tax=Siphonobacter curvatus TaxID=2094562 RepID=A0A2S7ISA9_9BACT|nr:MULTISPECIES: RagB/SusD family nutrient uptake outer membrane protein [Siphonobacter]OZI08845.1 RagB/SusD family nutrient uptake outer membrane protein [Siphonobacter sp. BAB-5385]PQA60566.1 RagB/SusD family nutrient uptake outer membrane protein [Siphonobacter curvatus]
MKVNKYILRAGLFTGLALSGVACKDYLDVAPQGELTPDYLSSDPKSAEGIVTAIYNKMLDWNIHSFSWIGITSIASDDADKGSDPGDSGSDKNELDGFTFSATSGSFNDIWQGNYQGIARANQALTYLPTLTIDEASKNRLIGEATFLRAYFYFNLVRTFGGVPLITTVPNPTNEADLQAGRTRTTAEAIYAQIEADLNTAVTNLPEKGSIATGRATKGAAQALLAKVSMYQKKWDKVLELTNAVITGGKYSLVDDYSTIWREVGENNAESIFEVQAQGTTPNKGINNYSATQGVRGQWGWGFNTPSADLEKAYEPGDKRKAATIMYPGEVLWDGQQVLATAPNPRYNKKAYVSRVAETYNGNDEQTNKNMRILRFAEVLLMHAEASNELGQSGNALISLNKVRVRAGLQAAQAGSQSDLRLKIWNERRVELAMEHDRMFDLRRQGRAATVLRALGLPYVSPKHDLFPIPQTQIDLSGGQLKQNPGY